MTNGAASLIEMMGAPIAFNALSSWHIFSSLDLNFDGCGYWFFFYYNLQRLKHDRRLKKLPQKVWPKAKKRHA